ncbi:MAG: histidine kinase dimerization/phospho-acceptor domain-containing protein [Cytophagales bacterium]
MTDVKDKVEKKFFNVILWVVLPTVLFVSAFDYYYFPNNLDFWLTDLSMFISVCAYIVLFSVLKRPNEAVVFVTAGFFINAIHIFFNEGGHASNAGIIFIALGFLYSIMLSGFLRWVMHILTVICIVLLYILEDFYPDLINNIEKYHSFAFLIPLLAVYLLISITSEYLKSSYYDFSKKLAFKNQFLKEKNKSIKIWNRIFKEQASEKTEKIEKYLQGYSHELRAPLARIMGLLNLASKIQNDPEFNKEILRRIEIEAKELEFRIKSQGNILED